MLSPADLQAAPHLALINRDAAKAENLFPTLAAVQANYNEFANLVTRAGMRLMSTSEPTAQVMANLQRELSRAIPLN
ncbi:MAG: hypothetical protein HY246_01410 [Proteobacteria bacterium]|nr:hypothetical protein [Pseudomonadota bacterium]